jgi:hypothetical protein
MLIRTLLAVLTLVTVLIVHLAYPYVQTASLVFISAISIGNIFIPHLNKMAIGALIVLLEIGLAFLIAQTLSDSPINNEIASILHLVNLLVIGCLVGVSSALLYLYAKYHAWESLGSLGVFVTLLVVHFHGESPQVQGVGLVLGILTAIPWLVGLAVGAAIRHHRAGNGKGVRNEWHCR